MRTSERWLSGTAVVLVILIVAQVLLRIQLRPAAEIAASWAEEPASLEETAASAEQVLLGRVTRVRRGQDLVVPVKDLPGGEDRVPVEIVTIRLEKSLKGPAHGGPPETIEVFRTGASSGRDQVTMVEDPPYSSGEQYALFVKPGPEVQIEGTRLRVHRLVSPEGRYRVRGGKIEPAARHGFAAELRGRSAADFEADVTRSIQRGRPR
jgi:hypothetical protein